LEESEAAASWLMKVNHQPHSGAATMTSPINSSTRVHDRPSQTASRPSAPGGHDLGNQIRSDVQSRVSESAGRGSSSTRQPPAGWDGVDSYDRANPSRATPASMGSTGVAPTGTAAPSTDSTSPTDPGAVGTVGKSGDPQVDQWDPIIEQEAAKWGVPPDRLKAVMMLESGGDPNATQINPQHGNTYGLMQVNQAIWGETAAQRGYDLGTPEGQIGFAASLLRDYYDQTGSWDAAHSMYFNPAGTGDSVNGTSNQQYIDTIHDLMNSLY
jgi:soluble lytic murein transglycosylase-like protein